MWITCVLCKNSLSLRATTTGICFFGTFPRGTGPGVGGGGFKAKHLICPGAHAEEEDPQVAP